MTKIHTIDLRTLNSEQGFIVQGGVETGQSGWSVSGAGDVNGDGYADVIIGAPFVSVNGRSSAGEGVVLFGKPTEFSTIDLSNFTSSDSQGFFIQGEGGQSTWSVSQAGDVNGDGYSDVIIGAPLASLDARPYAGKSYVLFGKASGFDTIDLNEFSSNDHTGFIIHGTEGYAWSGDTVSGAGDVNGDGVADVIIGSPSATIFGQVHVLFGKASGIATVDLRQLTSSGSQGFIIHRAESADGTGEALSGAGDVNGDGYAILIGAYGASPHDRRYAGTTYVVFGKEDGFTTVNLADFVSGDHTGFMIHGANAEDRSGRAVSSAGDVNRDGYDDIIIGAYAAAPNGRPHAGTSYILLGKASGFDTIDLANFTSNDENGWMVHGARAWDACGTTVSAAGDINGDGYADVMIGAAGASPPGRFAAGISYVLFGKAGGFRTIDLADFANGGDAGWMIYGESSEAFIGSAISGAGDVDGDGKDDLILGPLGLVPQSRVQG